MTDTQRRWQEWVASLVEGDQEVVDDFWRRYGPRLEALAARSMTNPLRRREGADDVVQSVCRTFFRRAHAGQFDLPGQDCLWRLLCAITIQMTILLRDQSQKLRVCRQE